MEKLSLESGGWVKGIFIDKTNLGEFIYDTPIENLWAALHPTLSPDFVTRNIFCRDRYVLQIVALVEPTLDVTEKHSGRGSFKIIANGQAGAGGHCQEIMSLISLAGNDYTGSIYMKGTPGAIIDLKFSFQADGGGEIEASTDTVTLTSDWVRYSVSHTMVSDTPVKYIDLQAALQAPDTTSTFWMDNPQIELGTLTAYQVGPFSRLSVSITPDASEWVSDGELHRLYIHPMWLEGCNYTLSYMLALIDTTGEPWIDQIEIIEPTRTLTGRRQG